MNYRDRDVEEIRTILKSLCHRANSIQELRSELYLLFGSRVVKVEHVQDVKRPMFCATVLSPILGETISA